MKIIMLVIALVLFVSLLLALRELIKPTSFIKLDEDEE